MTGEGRLVRNVMIEKINRVAAGVRGLRIWANPMAHPRCTDVLRLGAPL